MIKNILNNNFKVLKVWVHCFIVATDTVLLACLPIDAILALSNTVANI